MARTRFTEHWLGRRALTGLLALFSSNPLHAGAADECLLFPQRSVLVEAFVREWLRGDVDNDGLVDFVSLDGDESGSVVLRVGDRFEHVANFSTLPASSPCGVGGALADVNGDGWMDIPLVYDNEARAVVLFGDGAGGFTPSAVLEDVQISEFPLCADVTGDGRADLISTSEIFPGGPDGFTDEGLRYEAAAGVIVAADVDNDMDIDLLSCSDLLRNDGTGVFSKEELSQTDCALLVTGDVDGDGDVDLVGASTFDDTNQFFENTGDGTFIAHDPTPAEYLSSFFVELALGDIDGDGDLDLASADSGGTRIAIFEKTGFAEFRDFPVISGQVWLEDVIGDALPDLLHSSSGLVEIHANIGGEPAVALPTEYELGRTPQFFVLADVDLDGDPDALVAHSKPINQFWVMRNDGCAFAEEVYEVGDDVWHVENADFNGDGWPDAVCASSSEIVVFINDRTGSFSSGQRYALPERNRSAVSLSDLDLDGDEDIIVSALGAAQGLHHVAILWNDGFGAFLPTTLDVALACPEGVTAARIDDDALPDIVLIDGEATSERLRVFRNLGNREFSLLQTLSLPSAFRVIAADFDADGDSDLAVVIGGTYQFPSTSIGYRIQILINEGGTLTVADSYPTVLGTGAVVCDANLDGVVDLLVPTGGSSESHTIGLLLGMGDGSFTASYIPFETEHAAIGARFADVDSDSRQELVLITSSFGAFGSLAIVETLGDYVEILTQPAERINAVEGEALVLAATADGLGELTYQWSRDGTPLSDDGRIAGVQSPALTIDPLACDDAGEYTLAVGGTCNTTSSDGTRITVFPATACALASVDCSAADIAPEGALDCIVDLADVGAVLANYEPGAAGKSRAQGDVFPPCAGDGIVDLADLGQVLAAFGADCN